jgi:hypothetical protein
MLMIERIGSARETEPVHPREPNASACPEPTEPARRDPRISTIFLSSLSHLVLVSAIFWFRSAI